MNATATFQSLGYGGGVRLLGRLGDRVAHAAEVYAGLGDDDVLKGFRLRAGLPAPGDHLTGWAAETTAATFGQWVSGLVRLGTATGDAALVEKAARWIDGYADTLGPDDLTGLTTYNWEKLATGLLDASTIGRVESAMPLLRRILASSGRELSLARRPATPHDRDGRRPDGGLEWYTLAEVGYRAYAATGDRAFEEFARLWHYDWFWDHFRTAPPDGRWPSLPWLHAYSHVNTFSSAAAAYEATGDGSMLAIARNGHDWAVGTQCYATGGFGPGEWTVAPDGTLGRALEWRSDTAEITCGSWAAFKLCSYLVQHTGHARYLEWVERLVYNGIGATPAVNADGTTPYYADYRLGAAVKLYHWDTWPCCSGTYLQAVAQLHDMVYYGTQDGLAVGLYVPSTLDVQRPTGRHALDLATAFPEEPGATITVRCTPDVPWTLRLRIPGWAVDTRIEVNGEPWPLAGEQGWAVIGRRWSVGDVVTIRVESRLATAPVDAQHPHRVAVTFGPVVLAQLAEFSSPLSGGAEPGLADLQRLLVRAGSGLRFLPRDPGPAEMPVGEFVPLYEVPYRRPYRIYHDLDNPRVI